MLLEGYKMEMFRPKCNHNFQSVHCAAHLDQDISEVLPYLNTVLGGTNYAASPPALTLQAYGKLITLHSREIYVNALQDEEEAEKILKWLQHEINETWDKRRDISPTHKEKPKPQMVQILRLLPRTNCGECREPTCTVFALRATEGVKGPEDCPGLDSENRTKLEAYLSTFGFDT
jgi:ArsR family metal-binding transcriptional regulator